VARYFAPSFRIDVNGSRLASDVSKNITQVQVVTMPDTLDTFSFTLVNTLPTMRWTHSDDARLFLPGHSVTISMGYVDDMHEMVGGEITQVSPTFPDGGVPTVTIEGHSRMHRLLGNTTCTYQKTNAKEIAELIGKSAGLQVKADPVDVKQEYAIQANQSDFDYLKKLAESVHFEVLVQNKTLIFRKSPEAQPTAFTFIWYGSQESFTSGPDTFPLRSFSPRMNAMVQPTKVEHRSWDMKSKKAMVSCATSADQTDLMCGTLSGADFFATAFGMQRNVVNVTHPFATQDEGNRRAVSDFYRRALGFIGGTAQTIGVPRLRAGQKIELKGLGQIFDGCYLIDEATHSIGESGYGTSFTVKRNATNG
jgi:phage protein D